MHIKSVINMNLILVILDKVFVRMIIKELNQIQMKVFQLNEYFFNAIKHFLF